MKRVGYWLLAIGYWWTPAVTTQSPDAAAIVRRAGLTFRNLTSLQADFVQVIEDPSLGDTLRTNGRLYQAGPNAFAMRFSDPPEEAIVIDGTHVWLYFPAPRRDR
jgi:outer membrane lipoprotein-sorting protein